MIGKLKGIVDSISSDHILIDASGVGYLVFCSSKVMQNLREGEFAELLIDTHVREDHIHLFGFSNKDEKNAFQILQSVKGVGTKMALAILSLLSPPEIQNALLRKDTNAFSAVSGVGKKLAERIITELKDKTISSADLSILKNSNIFYSPNNDLSIDAISALINLGINKNEATNRVGKIIGLNPNINLNELIKLALQNSNTNI